MEIQEVITNLKEKFGDKVDVTKITEKLKGMDLKGMDMTEIITKLKSTGTNLVGDLDGDGKVEGVFEEVKGKVGSFFHHG